LFDSYVAKKLHNIKDLIAGARLKEHVFMDGLTMYISNIQGKK